jgi:eukaryotic-like serine/threonine-protein kinase
MSASRPPPSMPYPPGTVLVGKYRIERLLGEGGMGWVVVATHLQLEQKVALKFMHTVHAADHPDAVGRFLREARAAARVQSEHVARVSDVGTLENGAPYLVMEYLEGQDLEHLLAARGSLPVEMAIDYVVQACEGLAEAHAAGIVHRDLKPANLFLARRSDGSLRVKLLDFGISKLAALPGAHSDVGMTSTQALMGSPLYMSPEQLRSAKNVDRRTDLWSMGIILFEALSGRSPFESDTLPGVCAMIMAEPAPSIRLLRPEIPVALEAVVMRCLEKDPSRRYADAAALAEALAPFGGAEVQAGAQRVGRVVRAAMQSGPDLEPLSSAATAVALSGVGRTNAAFTHSSRNVRRSPALAFAVGAGALTIAAIVIGVVLVRGRHAPEAAQAVPSATVSSTAPQPAETVAAPAATTATSATTAAATATAAEPPPPTATATTAPTARPIAATTAAAPLRPVGPVTAKPKATSTAKPAGTSGFGGRD